MNAITWVIAGAGAVYILFLAWLIRRHRSDPVQLEADRGTCALEECLKQQSPA